MQLIRERELPPDAEVPAENLLAERFGVARGTVRSGLAELAARGILEKRGRRMHVVSRPGGALFFSSAHPTPEFDAAANQLAVSGLPVVASAHEYLYPNTDHVLSDHELGARLLTEELLRRGC